jgi:hypothetical protein
MQVCLITALIVCKANTLPILMHQMRISTTKVSSVVLRPEKSWKSENSQKIQKKELFVCNYFT